MAFREPPSRLHDCAHGFPLDQPYQYVGELGCYKHHQDPNLDVLHLGV